MTGSFAGDPRLPETQHLDASGADTPANAARVTANHALAERAREILGEHATGLAARVTDGACVERIGIGAGPSATTVAANQAGHGVDLWLSADARQSPRGDEWSGRLNGITGQHADATAGEGWSDLPRDFFVGDGFVPATAIGDAMSLTQVRRQMNVLAARVTKIARAPEGAPGRYALTFALAVAPEATRTLYTDELVISTGLGEPRELVGAPAELRGAGNLVESAEDALAHLATVAPGDYLVLGPGATGAMVVELLARRGGPGVHVTWARAFAAPPFQPEDRSPRTEFAYSSTQVSREEHDEGTSTAGGGVARIRRGADGHAIVTFQYRGPDGVVHEREQNFIAVITAIGQVDALPALLVGLSPGEDAGHRPSAHVRPISAASSPLGLQVVDADGSGQPVLITGPAARSPMAWDMAASDRAAYRALLDAEVARQSVDARSSVTFATWRHPLAVVGETLDALLGCTPAP